MRLILLILYNINLEDGFVPLVLCKPERYFYDSLQFWLWLTYNHEMEDSFGCEEISHLCAHPSKRWLVPQLQCDILELLFFTNSEIIIFFLFPSFYTRFFFLFSFFHLAGNCIGLLELFLHPMQVNHWELLLVSSLTHFVSMHQLLIKFLGLIGRVLLLWCWSMLNLDSGYELYFSQWFVHKLLLTTGL